MPSPLRLNRIAERIRNELSEMLIYEIDDPRLSGVTVTDVKVDRELYYASIYVSALEGRERSAEILDALENASNFLRHQLSQSIELRTFPRLRFYWDPTPENADRIEFLLKQIKEEREANAALAAQDPDVDSAESDEDDSEE